MSTKTHKYNTQITWTGNLGEGTKRYNSYTRHFDIKCEGKPTISGSADPAYLGDATCWNPEELLLASLSACHKLFYLHLCSQAGIVVTSYIDNAEAILEVDESGGGSFVSAILCPEVTISEESDTKTAEKIHGDISKYCFIANSINFPVSISPTINSATSN